MTTATRGRPRLIACRPRPCQRAPPGREPPHPRRKAAMTTATRPQSRSAESRADGAGQPADVLVVFGITGDLAKVMTFRSLYRLEARGLLNCPIVGVAVDDWTEKDLRERAHTSIEGAGETIDPAGFDPLAGRPSYVSGGLTHPAPH